MQFPNRSKYRKLQRSIRNKRHKKVFSNAKSTPVGIEMALVSLGGGRMTARQYEAARIILSRGSKRSAKLNMPCFTNFGVTKKAERSRMGKGKGATDHWTFVVCPGDILFTLKTLEANTKVAPQTRQMSWKKAMIKTGKKLPFKTKVVQSSFIPKSKL